MAERTLVKNFSELDEDDLREMRAIIQQNRISSAENQRHEHGWVSGWDHVVYCRPMIDEDIDWSK